MHADRSGAPSALAIVRVVLAFASVESDPDEARVNLRTLADPDALALETNESTLLIAITAGALLGELEVTLHVGARVLDLTPSTPLALGVVLETTAALIARQAPEDAARLRGATDTIVPGFAELAGFRAAGAPDATPPAYAEGSHMTEDEATRYAVGSHRRDARRRGRSLTGHRALGGPGASTAVAGRADHGLLQPKRAADVLSP